MGAPLEDTILNINGDRVAGVARESVVRAEVSRAASALRRLERVRQYERSPRVVGYEASDQ
jgi:hypothetical protein